MKTSVSTIVLVLFICFSCKNNKQETSYKYTNSLIEETSPYLLQHAHNPVNWIPWSQNALDQAEKDNKLVLISVGYSSCHWCHVMEEETFEDEATAQIMNESFINIKIDREERPDLDQVYMTALQLMTGSGGWPLNVITLPNGKPIYAGTYHTNEQWRDVLIKITKLYNENPEKLKEYADKVTSGIQSINLVEPAKDHSLLTQELLEKSIENWKTNWDLEWGGDLGNQKFVIPHNLNFLIDYAKLENNDEVLEYVENTLDKIALGGLYDHVGGGFFRYSTDKYWRVPHFEKMLYTNAQLISLYSKAYKIFKKPMYKEVVFETISFLKREMKGPKGGYYAAIDADSEGEEGKYYLWNKQELKSILDEDHDLFSKYYNVDQQYILETNNYALHKSKNDSIFIMQQRISLDDLKLVKKKWKKLLLEARQERIRPRIDDKIITSWNAILIKGFVDAYTSFGKEEFLNEAIAISDFLQKNNMQGVSLQHSYKKGNKWIDGFLEDYAFLTEAYLKLYSTTMDDTYLNFAKSLNKTVGTSFEDTSSEMFLYTKGEKLISKILKVDDGVLPSPNSVVAHNLYRLGHLYYDKESLSKSKNMLSSMVTQIEDNAGSYSNWDLLLLNSVYPFYEVAIVGKDAGEMIKDFNTKYIPNVLIVGSKTKNDIPLVKNRFVDGETYIYVCQEGKCKLPVKTVNAAIDLL